MRLTKGNRTIDRVQMGLRTATPEEIQEHIRDLKLKGYRVEHRTKGLKYNGVLIGEKDLTDTP